MLKLLVLVSTLVGVFAPGGDHLLEHSDLCHEVEHRDCSTYQDAIVCATDHHTYYNSCEFAKAVCKNHKEGLSLEAVHYGPCAHHEHHHDHVPAH